MTGRRLIAGGALLGIAAVAIGWYVLGRRTGLPPRDSQAYQELVRVFYRGLAALDTGLLDNAQADFTRATVLAPGEPATWANLGIVDLRRAETEEAARAIERAATLAPSNAEIEMLRAALAVARGNSDAEVSALRRAISLDSTGIRPKFALADALARSREAGGAPADAEAARLLDEILAIAPGNLAALVERTRIAVLGGDSAAVGALAARIAAASNGWPQGTLDELAGLRTSAAGNDLQAAGRNLAFLRNLLAQVPAYRDSLSAVRVPPELSAEAFARFIVLPSVSSRASPPDRSLSYAIETIDAAPALQVAAWSHDEIAPSLLVSDVKSLRSLGALAGTWPFDGLAAVLPVDWNHDFRRDLLLAGKAGVRLLLQEAQGRFAQAPPAALGPAIARTAAAGVWIADLDMDGDLDLVVGAATGPARVVRNNGDGTSRELNVFADVNGARGFVWGDLDRDGDPDPVLLDERGALHLFTNQQAGAFERRTGPARTGVVAIGLGDVNADGVLDLITLDLLGAVKGVSLDAASGSWIDSDIVSWPDMPSGKAAGTYKLFLADLDNNGALDLVASGNGATGLWLAGERGSFSVIAGPQGADVHDVADLDGDGRLDLVGLSGGQPVKMTARASQPYHWQIIRARAAQALGDQRINSFGVGGEIEVRAGLLTQKQVLTGGPVHVGLGTQAAVDVARIVWPNGVLQAEFELRVDQRVTAEQRLKGSCPWVFAYDGKGMGFVTDFLWRSPLGLRINAQDTAGVTQTEDWVKIRGDQLVPRENGTYDIRITAELWESHFIDHVSLMAVDHPAGSEIYVDERFARDPPTLAVHAVQTSHAVSRAWDDRRRDLTQEVQRLDGRHAAGFERGRYQGLAFNHAIEFDLGAGAPAGGALWLLAQGWVYPTDSSINVAIAQARLAPPHGLALDAQAPDGTWRRLHADLGFPAGKNKTILIDLTGRPAGARRFRLRTNMEIYWDRLSWAIPASATDARQTRLAPSAADLRYRGFSRTAEDKAAHAPELPRYAELASVSPRWRDLVGFHTRFGDVLDLLTGTDDRYVIMNAGDELRLSFRALPPPPDGWTRDFVLVGDGWEKDGDFNTGYSKTVQPLPLHGRVDYKAPASPALEDDPAYQRHPDDWRTYHTRFVAPDRYLRGLFLYKN